MKARRYNAGKLKWSLVSWKALAPLVKVLMYGAHKYSVWESTADGSKFTGVDITPEGAQTLINNKEIKLVSSGANNWKSGMPVTEVWESLQRHLHAWIEGEDNDDESGLSHLGHAMCNLMFLSWIMIFKRETFDDRGKEDE